MKIRFLPGAVATVCAVVLFTGCQADANLQPVTSPPPASTPAVSSPSPTETTTTPPQTTTKPPVTTTPAPVEKPEITTPVPRFTWTKDESIRVENGAIPFAMRLDDGRIRLYYGTREGIKSSISDDGLTFTEEPGTRIQPGSLDSLEPTANDPTVVRLPDGGYRMYYKGAVGQGGPGQSIHRIFSAYSSDGLEFVKEGMCIDSTQTPDDGWASVPDALVLPDGRVRLYYVSDGNDVGHGIVAAVSEDGLNFTREGPVMTSFVDPSVMILDNGDYLMLAVDFSHNPMGICSFTSSDGISFTGKEVVLSGPDYIDPAIIQLTPTTFRVYYWSFGDEPSVIYSLTGTLVNP